MKRTWQIATTLLLLSAGSAVLWAQNAAPDKKPAPPKWTTSPLLVKQVQDIPAFLSHSQKVTLATMGPVVDKTMRRLMEDAGKNGLQMLGAPIFHYIGMTGPDPNAAFTLEIGFPIQPTNKKVEGVKIAPLPGITAATTYYTGPMQSFGQAIGQFYGELTQAGHIPAGPHRELYYHWVGDDSPNNVIEIQVEIQEK